MLKSAMRELKLHFAPCACTLRFAVHLGAQELGTLQLLDWFLHACAGLGIVVVVVVVVVVSSSSSCS